MVLVCNSKGKRRKPGRNPNPMGVVWFIFYFLNIIKVYDIEYTGKLRARLLT